MSCISSFVSIQSDNFYNEHLFVIVGETLLCIAVLCTMLSVGLLSMERQHGGRGRDQ